MLCCKKSNYSNLFHKYSILVLDFGSQYTQLIVKQIRLIGVYCEVFSWNISVVEVRKFNPNGLILTGSPESSIDKYSPYISQGIYDLGIPILGICYGMHIMTIQLGGKVNNNICQREFGHTLVRILVDSVLIDNLYDNIDHNNNRYLNAWMSHNDSVISVPPGFNIVGMTDNCPVAIMANEDLGLYGVQFHPEVTHTNQGCKILKNFVIDICKCQPSWKIDTILLDKIISNLRETVGNDQVILGLSGGIDSTVTALLLKQAIGEQLICIFIDNGLLHFNESYAMIKSFCKVYNLNIRYIVEEDRFFKALSGITDPEEKRKVIGRIFIEIFEEQIFSLPNILWLAQGTIYSDVIESIGWNKRTCNRSQSYQIKSHHNVGGLPSNIKVKLLEPLRDFFKDEVRKLGYIMGLPDTLLYRHPYPGPGLGIRILGEVRKEYCDMLRLADLIFIEELKKWNLYDQISQAFVVFLPIRSVGIQGDKRKYDWVVSLRAINSIDFMTAECVDLPYNFLTLVSNRIMNEIDGISRVVYDISSKPPSTIEWE